MEASYSRICIRNKKLTSRLAAHIGRRRDRQQRATRIVDRQAVLKLGAVLVVVLDAIRSVRAVVIVGLGGGGVHGNAPPLDHGGDEGVPRQGALGHAVLWEALRCNVKLESQFLNAFHLPQFLLFVFCFLILFLIIESRRVLNRMV